jgi:hypothetical protein
MRPLYEAAAREAERKHREAQLAERKRLDEVHASVDVERVERLAAPFREQVGPTRPLRPNDKPIAPDDPEAASLRRLMGRSSPEPDAEPREKQWLTDEPREP